MRTIVQAGAIIAGLRDREAATLLVTGRRNPHHWIFPKGHVEHGETLEETALREADEEAGIRGTLLGPAGRLTFTDGTHAIHVHYFVVITRDAGWPESGRRLRWCSLDDALQHLTFSNSRTLLRRVWPVVVSHLADAPVRD